MTAILTALSSGMTAEKILAFLMRKSPELAPRITKSLSSGMTADKVLKFFSKEKNFEKLRAEMEKKYSMDMDSNPLVQAESVRGQNLGTDIGSSLQRQAPKALATAAGLGVDMAINHAFPNLLKGPIQKTSPQNPTNPQTPPSAPAPIVNPQSPSPSPAPAPIIPQGNAIAQPKGISNPREYLDNLGVREKVDTLLQAKNTPEAIAASLGIKNKKGKAEGVIDPELVSVIEEYAKSKPEETNKSPTIDQVKKLADLWKQSKMQNPNFPHSLSKILQTNLKLDEETANQLSKAYEENLSNENDQMQKYEKFRDEFLGKTATKQPEIPDISAKNAEIPQVQEKISPKIEKNQTVSSEHGLGEVKEIRNGKAIIEVDGKKHKVDVDDLDPPAFSEDEVADAYDNLMNKTPEEYKSGFIQWAGYDEEKNKIGFIPRGGKYEELTDITPEEAQIIKEGKGVARTTGETREGLWVIGEDTRGGLISQILHDRRKANKSQEEKQLKLDFELPKPEKEDKGMKPIFDELAYARNLSKERDRKKKLEERARLKKEKDEAKKRKK